MAQSCKLLSPSSVLLLIMKRQIKTIPCLKNSCTAFYSNLLDMKIVPSSKRTQQKGTFVLTVLGMMATDANAKNAFNEQQINYAQDINLGTFATQVKLEVHKVNDSDSGLLLWYFLH